MSAPRPTCPDCQALEQRVKELEEWKEGILKRTISNMMESLEEIARIIGVKK